MNIKGCVKKLLSPVFCLKHGFPILPDIYVGKGAKIVHGRQFKFASGTVSFMPYSMTIARTDKSYLILGKSVQIGMFSRIACDNYIKIGNRVTLAQNVFVADYNHAYEDINKAIFSIDGDCQGLIRKPSDYFNGKNGVEIKDDTWIGANSVIVGTVVVGKHVVIGANSVVTKDIPDYCVAVGAPARVIKKYNFETNKWEKV